MQSAGGVVEQQAAREQVVCDCADDTGGVADEISVRDMRSAARVDGMAGKEIGGVACH